MELIKSLTTNDNESHDHQYESENRVEIATIQLPGSMIMASLNSVTNGFHYPNGRGNDFGEAILRANPETVENIIESSHQSQYEQTDTTDQKTVSSNLTLNIASGTAEIQAVVDLKKLSELAGYQDLDEFVECLYPGAEEDKQDEQFFPMDEEIELLSNVSVTKLVEEVAVSATPFVEILCDQFEHEAAPVPDDTVTLLSDFIDASTIEAKDNEDRYHNITHDAFLLDIPVQQESNEPQRHHFVLALPEIQMDQETASESSEEFTLLERAFSILPSDVQEVNFEATSVPVDEIPYAKKLEEGAKTTEIHLDLIVKRSVPLIGYVILISGLLALASVGAALDLQKGGVSASMKTFWRLNATTFVTLPLAVVSIYHSGLPKLSTQQILLLPVAAASYGFMTDAFVIALNYTSLADAFVLSNMTCIVIIIGKAILGYKILPAEGFGALIGFLGAAICSRDQEQDSTPLASDQGLVLIGNILALSSCFGTATYLIIAKSLRPSMDLFVFMFLIMFLASICVYIYMVVSGEIVTFTNHPIHGLYGWTYLEWDRLPLEMYMAIICNVVGTTGYIAVMKYFDPVVVSTVMLMEPVIGAFMGFLVGTDPLPGSTTWIGDVIVTIGSAMVIYSGSKKVESIDATEVLRPIESKDKTPMHTPIIVKSPFKLKDKRKEEEYGSIASPYLIPPNSLMPTVRERRFSQ